MLPGITLRFPEVTDDDGDPIGGKDIHHVATYNRNRHPGDKAKVRDVVTDDGHIYRFTRLSPGDPLRWQHRIDGDGGTDTARRVLPGEVERWMEQTNDDGRKGDVIYA